MNFIKCDNSASIVPSSTLYNTYLIALTTLLILMIPKLFKYLIHWYLNTFKKRQVWGRKRVQIRQVRKHWWIPSAFLRLWLNWIWTRLRPQTWRFLNVFRYQCIKYLNNLGIISINNVVRAIRYVLYDVLDGTIDAELSHLIKFNLY